MSDDRFDHEVKQSLALSRQESENLAHFYLGVGSIFIAFTEVKEDK